MLIQSVPQVVQDNRLIIPNWNRAPIYMFTNADVYIATMQETPEDVCELILSTFPPATWGDLWRIEIGVHNRKGIQAELTDVLSRRHIHVLNSETTVHQRCEVATMSLLVDCQHYNDELDGKTSYRKTRSRPSLPHLEAALGARFIKDLLFSAEHDPRLRLRRIQSYWQCNELLQNSSIPAPEAVRYSDDGIEISARLAATISKAPLSESNLRVGFLTDAKDRIMRALFYHPDRGNAHLRIFFQNQNDSYHLILAMLKEAGFDIMRSQLCHGTFEPPQFRPASSGVSTLDVLLQSKGVTMLDDDAILASVDARIKGNMGLRNYSVQVMPVPPRNLPN